MGSDPRIQGPRIHADGQIASADYGNGKTEEFLWDGLALIHRGGEQFINEPHIGGGNPVVSSKGVSYFNDMLGTTVGFKTNGKYSAAALTAFGERLDNVDSTSPAIRSLGEGWFTGKVLSQLSDIAPISSGSGIFVYETDRAYANFVQVHWVLAGGRVQTHSIVNYSWHDEEREGILYRLYSITRDTFYYYSDSFSDPLAFDETVGIPFEIGFPYIYSHAWDKSYSWKGEYALE